MTEAYNQIIDAHAVDPPDALILLHDDLQITDYAAEAKFLDALQLENVELVGVAGGYDIGLHGLAWWNAKTVGHQLTEDRLLEFGPREGYVTSLEGSIMVLSPWAVRNVRFDQRFTGFHGYDDIGMTVNREHSRHVWVADVDTYHHTRLGFDSIESERVWLEADRKFREKWNLGGVSDPAQDVQ
jgi:glycosyl transferase family 2